MNTFAIFIINPHNPNGNTYSEAHLKQLDELAKELSPSWWFLMKFLDGPSSGITVLFRRESSRTYPTSGYTRILI
ncbi:hypothetical protein F2Q68_00029928 [Brassica cretica]|uniref:Uncharacterized protein n=1 Tax=Brassica cretica TaxID=69181 RepID=A0A8S9GD33_BRACR|nr:hypothetical protein F2Q68_00029928 [Brassica cretica]